MATALESADHATFVTLSRAGIAVRSVQRSMSTGAVARRGRSSGRVMSESVSLARGACAHPERATASTKKYARPFPLLTQLIKGADRPMRNGHEVSNEFVTRATERPMRYAREDLRGRGGDDAKPSEHRLGRHEQGEPNEERCGSADHERKTRIHGGRLIEHGRGWDYATDSSVAASRMVRARLRERWRLIEIAAAESGRTGFCPSRAHAGLKSSSMPKWLACTYAVATRHPRTCP